MRNTVFYLFVALLAIIPIVYFFDHIPDEGFLSSAMGDWFATMIGAIAGIPIALALSKWQLEKQEERQQSIRTQEARDREIEILGLIRTELGFNYEQIERCREKTGNGIKREVFVNGLRDELWDAFSDGGQLQWIRDVQLLHDMSLAYHYVRRIVRLENSYLELTFSPVSPTVDTVTPRHDLIQWLGQIDDGALTHIEQACEGIEANTANG